MQIRGIGEFSIGEYPGRLDVLTNHYTQVTGVHKLPEGLHKSQNQLIQLRDDGNRIFLVVSIYKDADDYDLPDNVKCSKVIYEYRVKDGKIVGEDQ